MTTEPLEGVPAPRPITAVYRLAPGEYMAAVRILSQRSKFAIAVGLLLTVLGVVSLVIGLGLSDPVSFLTSVVLQIVLGVALLTGWYCVPFCWYAIRKRPELFSAEMTFEMDDTGLRYRTSMYDSRVAWPYVRRVRDLGRFLFFDNGAGANLFVPERVFDSASLAAVRRTLGERGLLRD